MGDRANIKFKHSDGKSIYLYGHWAGGALAAMLQEAMKMPITQARLRDEAYATRIIIGQIIKDHIDEETGWGVGTQPCDNEYNIVEVDFEAQKVRSLREPATGQNWEEWEKNPPVIAEWTFAEFIALEDPQESVHPTT